MAQIHVYPVVLPFEYDFTISRHSKREQPLLIVSIEQDGIVGYGETAENAYYRTRLDDFIQLIESVRENIEQETIDHPEVFWRRLKALLQHKSVHPHLIHFTLCALDMAAWDWYGRKLQQPLYRCWTDRAEPRPLTDYTIGIDQPEVMLEKMQAHPWPIYKIKVGTANDMRILQTIRQHTHSRLRIDANAGWDITQLQQYYPICRQLRIELIEQPLPVTDDWQLASFPKMPELPLFADESCVQENDVQHCAHLYQGINIKLTKCGGITPALRMIKQARAMRLKIMLGSMNESIVGTSAAAHLLPLVDEADLDGPLLLQASIATGIRYKQGKILFADAPGTGVSLLPEFQRYVVK
ncbi:MAG: dipeptide epimerase [Thermoflavifilum sp.]|nr:dipeptide epimerase [Thermoflavifilum sp.]